MFFLWPVFKSHNLFTTNSDYEGKNIYIIDKIDITIIKYLYIDHIWEDSEHGLT